MSVICHKVEQRSKKPKYSRKFKVRSGRALRLYCDGQQQEHQLNVQHQQTQLKHQIHQASSSTAGSATTMPTIPTKTTLKTPYTYLTQDGLIPYRYLTQDGLINPEKFN